MKLMHQHPLAVLLGSVALLAALLYGASAASVGRPTVIRDSFAYNASAQRLVNTGVYEYTPDVSAPSTRTSGPGAFTTPGYSLFLSAFYLFDRPTGSTAENILDVQAPVIGLQLLLAIASAVGIAIAGYRIGGIGLGWTAGLLADAYMPFGMNATVMLTETLALFLTTFLLVACVELLRSRQLEPRARMRWAIAIGVLGGLGALVRPTIALWLVVPFAIELIVHRAEMRRAVVTAAVGLAAFALVLTPWVVRNAVSLDRFIPLMASASTPLLDSVGGATFSDAENEMIEQARREGRDPFREVALARLKARWEASPAGFIGWKLGTMWTGVSNFANLPLDVLVDLQASGMPAEGTYADAGRLLPRSDGFYNGLFGAVTWYHRLLLLLALVGVAIGRRRAVVWMLASVPLYYAAVHTLILFMIRYFYPAMPALILLAAFGLAGSWHLLRQPRRPAENGATARQAAPAS